MDAPPTELFARIIQLAESTFEHVEYSTDYAPERAILRLRGLFAVHRVFVIELIANTTRKYSYYVLRGDWVEIGFDNSSDPDAIRLKYSKIGMEHTGELVPHAHRMDKSEIVLTEEMTFEKFVDWLKANLTE